MDIKTGIGTAIGKIILMGEHSVVYGKPAIAIPFPTTKITTTVRKAGPSIMDCYFYYGLLSNTPEQLLGLTTIIKEIIKGFGQGLQDFNIKIESTIPPERGMGSSAAVAIATIRALYDYYDQSLTNEELLKWADVSEKIVHGSPSGIDAAIISGETSLYFVKGKPFEPFPFKIDAYLIVADTGELGNTKDAVKGVSNFIESNVKKGMDLINLLGNLTNNAKDSIKVNDALKLGESMTNSHHILDKLGVSNETLNHLVHIALNNGALGAKLTGGGRGGCMIALASDKDKANSISDKLISNGAINTWISNLGADIF